MRSANTLDDLRPSGYDIMLDLLAKIQSSAFPPISFLSKSEWNCLGNCPASELKIYSAEVIDVEDKYDNPYIQMYLVATSTKSRAQQCHPKATQRPKTMSI